LGFYFGNASFISDNFGSSDIASSSSIYLATIVWLNRYENSNDLVGSSVFGIESAATGGVPAANLAIRYDGLFANNIKGSVTVNQFEVVDWPCDYDSFTLKREAFNDLSHTLDNLNVKVSVISSTSIYNLLDMTTVLVQSKDWKGCEDYALSKLVPEQEELSTTDRYCRKKVGSPDWYTDGCCNSAISSSTCCALTNDTKILDQYSLPDKLDIEACQYSGCIKQSFTSLTTVLDPDYLTNCQAGVRNKLQDPNFTSDHWAQCVALTSYRPYCANDGACTAAGPKSKCIFFTTQPDVQDLISSCTAPCDDNNPCYIGNCTLIANYGRICTNIPNDPVKIWNAFTTCLFDKLDPFVAVIARNIVTNSLDVSDDAFPGIFKKSIQSPSCVAPDGDPGLWTAVTSPADCAKKAGVCGFLGCSLDDSNCTARCEAPAIWNSGVCGLRRSSASWIPVGRPNTCQVRLQDTKAENFNLDPVLCLSSGGAYVPEGFAFRYFQSCIMNGNFQVPTDCYVDECIPNLGGVDCFSYCYDTVVSPILCTGTWMMWTSVVDPTKTLSRCVHQGLTKGQCDSMNYAWFFGREFLPALVSTREECAAGICWNSKEGFDLLGHSNTDCLRYHCSTCYTGNEPQCASKEACEQTDACIQYSGCWLQNGFATKSGARLSYQWSPKGDITTFIGSVRLLSVSTFVNTCLATMLEEYYIALQQICFGSHACFANEGRMLELGIRLHGCGCKHNHARYVRRPSPRIFFEKPNGMCEVWRQMGALVALGQGHVGSG